MIHFGLKDEQQVLGDNIDPRLEHSLKHHPSFPISLWSHLARPQGIYAFAVGLANTTETVGIHDTCLDSLTIDNERSYLHIYDNANVNSIDMVAGMLHVMKGGYVATLAVRGPSEVHITGHVGMLDAQNKSQVFLHEGAYVDNLVTSSDAYVRISKGAAVYSLNAKDSSSVLIADKRCINRYAGGKERVVLFTEELTTPLIKVDIRFHKEGELTAFCKEMTEQYEKTGRLTFGDEWLSGVHGCNVFDSCSVDKEGVDTVEFSADAASNDATTVILAMRQHLMALYSSPTIDIKWEGKPELEVIKTPVRVCDSGCHAKN